MFRVSLEAAAVSILCLACQSDRPHAANDNTYFRVLTVPPDSVGTCEPISVRAVGPETLSSTRLVMVSLPPGKRREMTVTANRQGRVIGYNELAFEMTGRTASRGDNIVAAIDALGHVNGWRAKSNTEMAGSLPARPDAAALRAIADHMKTTTSRDALDSAGQRVVLDLVKWLRARCPN